MVEEKVPTFEELEANMSNALASGDPTEIEAAAAAITKSKGLRQKAAVEAERKEAEQLASKREALGKKVFDLVRPLVPAKELLAVKAKGFTFTIDHVEDKNGRLDPSGDVKVTGGIALMVPVTKARKSGGGGAGKTQDQYGLTLDEVFAKFATDDDRDKYNAVPLGPEGNSKRWQIKNAVKKRAIADEKLKPVS